MDDAELLDILEPHYVNMGFAWGEEAREAARKSVTFKQLKARDAAIRIDELLRLNLNHARLGGVSQYYMDAKTYDERHIELRRESDLVGRKEQDNG